MSSFASVLDCAQHQEFCKMIKSPNISAEVFDDLSILGWSPNFPSAAPRFSDKFQEMCFGVSGYDCKFKTSGFVFTFRKCLEVYKMQEITLLHLTKLLGN